MSRNRNWNSTCSTWRCFLLLQLTFQLFQTFAFDETFNCTFVNDTSSAFGSKFIKAENCLLHQTMQLKKENLPSRKHKVLWSSAFWIFFLTKRKLQGWFSHVLAVNCLRLAFRRSCIAWHCDVHSHGKRFMLASTMFYVLLYLTSFLLLNDARETSGKIFAWRFSSVSQAKRKNCCDHISPSPF